jgi:signal transduction histidine kinase/CheY-like chemotaxis protein
MNVPLSAGILPKTLNNKASISNTKNESQSHSFLASNQALSTAPELGAGTEEVRTEALEGVPKRNAALKRSWQGGSLDEQQSAPLSRHHIASPVGIQESQVGSSKGSVKRPLQSDTSPGKESGANKRAKTDLWPKHLDLSELPPQQPDCAHSPLFFSNTPQTRPALPRRHISYESGTATMRKSIVDDTGARTVKMARGSGPSSSSPPRDLSTSSGRPLNFLVNNRSTSAEREVAASGLHALDQLGLLELLEQDDRLVFIVDLHNTINFQPGPLQIVFANTSLKVYGSLCDIIRGRVADDASDLITGSSSFPEFKAWLTSFVKNREPMDVALPSFAFAGVTWTCSNLRKRFRVISGVGPSAPPIITSNPPSTGLAAFPPHSQSHSNWVPVRGGGASLEANDYFGMGASSTATDQPVSEEAVSSIENQTVAMKPALSAHKSRSALSQPKVASGSASPSSLQPASLIGSRPEEALLRAAPASHVDPFAKPVPEQGFFDWTRLPLSAPLPRHIRFARNIDWGATALGPIESWSLALRSMCNLMMASPHPAAMYWGEENVVLYNEAYIMLAGQKHPDLMGTPYSAGWREIWASVKDSFAAAKLTGQATMKDDDCLFIDRFGFLEETYFSWSIIPLVGDDGSVVGLYNPAFEKTRRKIAERRMLTLRDIGDRTAAAREVKSFWGQVLKGLEENEYDSPFVLMYSVGDDSDSDGSSMHSNSILSAKQCTLEGTLPEIPEGHIAAPRSIDLKSGTEGFAPVFREVITMDKPVLLETSNGTFDESLIQGINFRGFKESPRAAVVCPIHPTTGDSIIGFLVMGVNPRRPYDDDYNLYVQLLARQLATSMASVVLFEEEIRRGQRAAKLAALDRIELSEQLAARTKEAVESETKFTRMAEFAPVGMFIAGRDGRMIFTNDTFHDISRFPKGGGNWMDYVLDEDKPMLSKMWDDLIHKTKPLNAEFRFKSPWQDRNGHKGENWVLGNAYPETENDGDLKSVFGSITNISQQKWAEGYQRQRMEEAVELKRQQSNFIDMTSHEMRNPLSAILQCADEISGSLTEFKNNPNGKDIPTNLLESNIDAAQTIALCANHQTRIVSDVLTLSKLDSALLLVTPVDVQPVTIVQQTLKMFEGELATADIDMRFVRDSSLDQLKIDWVRLDPSRLLQVLINLTTNAIKFTTTQKKRTIQITLSASSVAPSRMGSTQVSYIAPRGKKDDITEGKDWGDGEDIYLSFSVQDTGKGLTEDEMGLLFLRFSQASPKTHVQYGGSGLGLFISRELVELQGGQIGVFSESGKGSTFAFYVKARRSVEPKDPKDHISPAGTVRKPIVTKPAKASTTNTSSRSPNLLSSSEQSLSYLKVLIVEDNLVNQKVLSKQLRKLDCAVYLANHGGECIDYLKKSKYWKGHEEDGQECSVILMDLEMPVMDGLTCTRKIRELQKTGQVVRHVPIIAVSANARSAHIDSALEAGMVRYPHILYTGYLTDLNRTTLFQSPFAYRN